MLKEIGHEGRGGAVEQLPWRTNLFKSPAVHHADAVRQSQCFEEIMRDENDGLVERLSQVKKLALQLVARHGVERTKGFIHEQILRVGGERTRDTHALLLTAGQVARQTVGKRLRIETDQIQEFRGTCSALLRTPADQTGNDLDVFRSGHVWKQSNVLEDIPDGSAQFEHIHVEYILAIQFDAATRRLDKPVDHFERRRLAAARGAKQHQRLTFAHLQAHIAHRVRLASVKRFGEMVKANHSRTASFGAIRADHGCDVCHGSCRQRGSVVSTESLTFSRIHHPTPAPQRAKDTSKGSITRPRPLGADHKRGFHMLLARAIAIHVPILLLALMMGGCQKTYYNTMEAFGVHKRDILVDRVEKARDDQQEAKVEFQTALDKFSSVVNMPGSNLRTKYDELNAQLKRCDGKAEDVRDRIAAIESVGDALFTEWEAELDQYSSADLRRRSEETLDLTRSRYDQLMRAMKRAEAKMDPVLVAFNDQVLFLKHNLNAQAIASLQGEVAGIEDDVAALIAEMTAAIAEANAFIDGMGEGG